MDKVMIYLFEASALLTILYLVYFLLLRRLNSFQFNRFYLLAALLGSMVLPLINIELPFLGGITIYEPVQDLMNVQNSYSEAVSALHVQAIKPLSVYSESSGIKSESNFGRIAYISIGVTYLMGLLIVLSKLVWSIIQIKSLSRKNPIILINGAEIVRLPDLVSPFSFCNLIFINDRIIEDTDLNQIIQHEKIHLQQRHSLDLLFARLLGAFQWFNPIVWTLTSSLKQAHEFIADRAIIDQGFAINQYQRLLLSQLVETNSIGLTHNFNLSFLKKRIAMMNNEKPGWIQRLKISFATIVAMGLSLTVFQCNSLGDQIESNFNEKEIEDPITMKLKSFSDPTNNENDVPSIEPIKVGEYDRVSSTFGMRMHPVLKVEKFHSGVDFKANEGTNIMATANGEVTEVTFQKDGYGKLIKIRHGDGYESWYAQMSDYAVEKGENVKKGEIIGYVGSSGLSTKPHLHYEVRKAGKPVNPQNYF